MYTILLLLLVLVVTKTYASTTIDDFLDLYNDQVDINEYASLYQKNTLGYPREIKLFQVGKHFVYIGIIYGHLTEYLSDPNTTDGMDVSGKALRIKCISNGYTKLTLEYTAGNQIENESATSITKIQAGLMVGMNDLVIPFAGFIGADLMCAQSIRIDSIAAVQITLLQLVNPQHNREPIFFTHLNTQLINFYDTVPRHQDSSAWDINVKDPTNIYDSVYNQISSMAPKALVAPLNIILGTNSANPINVPLFFTLLAREIVRPERALFHRIDATDVMHIIPYSMSMASWQLQRNHFRFVGRVIGMAIIHHHILDFTLSSTIYKSILSQISSTKRPWLRIPKRLRNSVETLTAHMYNGITDVISPESLAFLDEQLLDQIISGHTTVSISDWQRWTEFDRQNTFNAIGLRRFWEYMRQLLPSEVAKVLERTTGSPRVPVNGFQGLNPRFTIKWASDGIVSVLPGSVTSLNSIDLPQISDLPPFMSNKVLDDSIRTLIAQPLLAS